MSLNPPLEPIVNCHPVLSPGSFTEVTDVASNRDTHEIYKTLVRDGARHWTVRSPYRSDTLLFVIGKVLIQFVEQKAVACRVTENHADLHQYC